MSQSHFAAPASVRPPLLRPVILGVATIVVFFGGFGTWAAVTPLSSAAGAAGQIRVESHRKTIQHLEGGIIREILVREGDLVEAGQTLMRLDNVQASSSTDALRSQYHALQALEARLLAERAGLPDIVFPAALERLRSNPRIAADMDGQQRILATRNTSISGQIELLTQRAALLGSEMEAYQAQLAAAQDQIAIAKDELETVEDLVKKGIERRPRLLALQRELAKLQGDRGEQQGMIARSQQAIGETKLQIADLNNKRLSEVSAELRDTQTQLSELEERLRAAADVSRRTEILAPEAGRVVQLRHVTPGGVLRPGDPVLDLVPEEKKFVIEARVSPFDIDTVHAGLDAEIKLNSVKQRHLPILIGQVISVSADVLTDQRTGASYYMAEVNLPDQEVAKLEDVQLYPGMPVDVLIVTGNRTPLEYLVGPIQDSFHRAFRED